MFDVPFAYETHGASSYLVARFAGGADLIDYQLGMLTGNQIPGLLKATERRSNDDTLVSYQITSRQPLTKLVGKQKITRERFLKLLLAAAHTLVELSEYQLAGSGLLLDASYIFVRPDTFEAAFLYLPCTEEEGGVQNLKSFVESLLRDGVLERFGDDTIQQVFATLSDPLTTPQTIAQLCTTLCAGDPPRTASTAASQPAMKPQFTTIPQPAETRQSAPTPPPTEPPKLADIPKSVADADSELHIPPTPPVVNHTVRKPRIEKKPPKTPKKMPKEKGSSPKSIFIIVTAGLILIIAALVFSGKLNGENGTPDLSYVAALLLGAACVDFIVYRELFVNKKADKGTKKKEKEKKTPSRKTVAVPGKMPPAAPAPQSAVAQKPVPAPQSTPAPRPAPASQPAVPKVSDSQETYIPQAAVPAAAPVYASAAVSAEDTDLMEFGGGGEAFLEYYVNGLSNRVRLNREVTVVGKLQGQCDYVLPSAKVSKIHAEFIQRGGAYTVRDDNSTNGTYLNGSRQRIDSNVEIPLSDGDRIRLADVEMTFRA